MILIFKFQSFDLFFDNGLSYIRLSVHLCKTLSFIWSSNIFFFFFMISSNRISIMLWSLKYLTWERAVFTDILDFFWFGASELWRRWREARGWRRKKFQRFGVLNASMEVSSGSVTTRKFKKVSNNNLHQSLRSLLSFYHLIR